MEMENSLSSLYSKYPSLLAKNRKCTRFSWLRRVGDISCLVEIHCPGFPSCDNVSIEGDDTLLHILSSANVDISEIIESKKTLEELLETIDEVLTGIETEKQLVRSELSDQSVESIGGLVEELQSIGLANVAHISPDMRTVTLVSAEHSGHELTLLLPLDYPLSPATASLLLPESCLLPQSSPRIVKLYQGWLEALEMLTPSWRQLSELDRLCWVLDPEPVTPCHLYRRLVVTNTVTMHVELDPGSPMAMPVIKFLGSDQKTEPMRELLAENFDQWDEDDPLLTNLERLLGLELPSRAEASQSNDGYQLECGICYCYKLEDSFPTVSCEDKRCCQCFHESCLYEWLVNLPNCRVTLNMVTGDCPLCSNSIQCAKPTENI